MDNRGEWRPCQFWRSRESERERRDERTAAIPGPWTSATPEPALDHRSGHRLRRIDSGKHLGQATINGLGLVNYRIHVQDVGGPGKGQNTYQLIMDDYNSGEQTLGGGNIQIRRK